ncbi:MAG: hypothetical protein VX185_05480 [Pseudomonadota bacterium]|nr:hypothetical protein [Pseudomonadota bacterium]
MFHIDIWKLPFEQIQPEFDRIYNEGLLKPSSWERMAFSEFTELTLTSKAVKNTLSFDWVKLGIYIQDKLTLNENNRANLHSILLRGFNTRLRIIQTQLLPYSHPTNGLLNIENYFHNCLLYDPDHYFNLSERKTDQAKSMISARKSNNKDLANKIRNNLLEYSFVFSLISKLDDIDESFFSSEFKIQEWRAARARYHQKEIM